jgi:hypothetical protein
MVSVLYGKNVLRINNDVEHGENLQRATKLATENGGGIYSLPKVFWNARAAR